MAATVAPTILSSVPFELQPANWRSPLPTTRSWALPLTSGCRATHYPGPGPRALALDPHRHPEQPEDRRRHSRDQIVCPTVRLRQQHQQKHSSGDAGRHGAEGRECDAQSISPAAIDQPHAHVRILWLVLLRAAGKLIHKGANRFHNQGQRGRCSPLSMHLV
jgi:hypothetical protein